MSETEITSQTAEPDGQDVAAIEKMADAYARITRELDKVIVGQKRVVEELLIALFAGGHCLLVGVPGLAKTLMVRSLAETLSLDFNRIQFTPDLMPSDITGTEVIQEDRSTGTREFRFIEGPVFTTFCSLTKLTGRRQRHRPPCSKRCRSTR